MSKVHAQMLQMIYLVTDFANIAVRWFASFGTFIYEVFGGIAPATAIPFRGFIALRPI